MNRKNLFVLLGILAVIGLTGCGNSEKEAVETEAAETEYSTAAPEEVAEEDIVAEEIAEEETAEAAELEPITPSDYLIENIEDYVALGDIEGLEASQYIYEITDEMVEEQIQAELEMYSEEVEVDRASETGDIIYLDLTSTVSGEETTENTYFALGDEEYGAEFDEQLTGLSVGDTKEFSITFGDDIWLEEWIGQTVDFKAAVTSVCEISVPEYNDDFVNENTDYTTVEEYEEGVRESLTYEYEDISYSDAIEELFTAAEEQSVFAGYPEDLFEECKEELLSFYFMFTGSDDIEEVCSLFDITEEDIDAEVLYSVNRKLIISAICTKHNLEITEEEYLSFVEEYTEYYGYETAVQFEEDNGRASLVWSLYESKAAELLYEAAEITELPYEESADDAEIIEE